ncbi:hypothetical protein [Streptomyces sp. HUAS TT20]|uniref:hypothetical protein n=1 Tax=Streptomyces sp. HUAS TT20 TaxID=3447509 RepID=UPI0021D80C10|nr:hypothetical protein [Streptomyces sp. HUAS 15-9]UXY32908.1 hypothetical protein N8I87_00530 [Streptomyces sp. HUAS 15-9]
MDFGSGGNTEARAWKDIWGSGQGIGAVTQRLTVADLITTFKTQYEAAVHALSARTSLHPALPTTT